MKPIELVYLGVALLIVAQQLIVRKGEFDPVALGAIALFVGLVPAGRADRKKNTGNEASSDPSIADGTEVARAILREYLDKLRGGSK